MYWTLSYGCCTQPDPVGRKGNNPTLCGYVNNPITQVDIFGLSFWDMADVVPRSGRKFQGAEIYKYIDKVKVDGVKFKTGDYFYLDNLYKDHYETFSKLNESKVVFKTDGSLNADKTDKAPNRKGSGYSG